MTAATPLLLLLLSAGALGQSCLGRCGDDDGVSGCQCNSLCTSYGNCCDDFETICLSCKDRCGESLMPFKPCQCDDECAYHSDCCDDYGEVCGSIGDVVTDEDLQTITNEMFAADVNSVYDQLTISYEGQGPMFVSVPDSALNGPTISQLRKLQDNYIASASHSEEQDANEIAEQNAFLDAVMNTEVMTLAETFLQSNNLLSGSLRAKLHEMWFTLYGLCGAPLSSSGFEHTFVAEVSNGVLTAFQNWVFFQKEEAEVHLDYYGSRTSMKLGNKGEVLVVDFEWEGYTKESTMFVGTSPELEMAIYTVCFLARPDTLCPIQLSSQKFMVQTNSVNGNLVGSVSIVF